MFASRAWARAALFLNLLGTVLLFFSFQATSSNVRIVTTDDKEQTALCVENRALVIAGARGSFGVGVSACPEWEHARPAAVVNIEKPYLVTIGFILVAAGFLIQLLSVPDLTTMDQLRHDLRELKRKRSYGRR